MLRSTDCQRTQGLNIFQTRHSRQQMGSSPDFELQTKVTTDLDPRFRGDDGGLRFSYVV